jgi:excisionase family DNA binding protein
MEGKTSVEREEGEDMVAPRVAAKKMNVSRSLIYKLVKTGTIRRYLLGSAKRISMDELRRVTRQ